MKTSCTAGLALLATLSVAGAQEIEWKQVVNVPKAVNVPAGSGDILGIELGDSYAIVKTKLQALLAESTGQPAGPVPAQEQQRLGTPIQEQRQVFRMQVPGASSVLTASSVAKINLKRTVKGSSEDSIEVYLSAPSSGHQVIAVRRFINYASGDAQPRVSEMLGQLAAKMRSQPQEFPNATSGVYRFQYNDGKPFVPARPSIITCQTSLHALQNANDLQKINASGDCDALLEVEINYGISRDHVKSVTFTLNDNERVKANLSADYRFVNEYVRDLQQRTRGATPKL